MTSSHVLSAAMRASFSLSAFPLSLRMISRTLPFNSSCCLGVSLSNAALALGSAASLACGGSLSQFFFRDFASASSPLALLPDCAEPLELLNKRVVVRRLVVSRMLIVFFILHLPDRDKEERPVLRIPKN